jgi:hypothetical protein
MTHKGGPLKTLCLLALLFSALLPALAQDDTPISGIVIRTNPLPSEIREAQRAKARRQKHRKPKVKAKHPHVSKRKHRR